MSGEFEQRPPAGAARSGGVLDHVADRWPEGVIALGGLFLTLAAPGQGPAWLFAVRLLVASLVAVATVASWRRTTTRRRLSADNARLSERLTARTRSYRDAVEGYLARVANERLGFGPAERVSLYKHQQGVGRGGGSGFVLVGRYSEHPRFGGSSGRTLYPEGQGCLGAAWVSTETPPRAVAQLPDPRHAWEDYVVSCERDWDVPAEVTRSLRMPSRHIVAQALLDPAARQRLGVVVFESQRESGLPIDELDAYLEEEGQALAEFIASDDAPDVEATARGGF